MTGPEHYRKSYYDELAREAAAAERGEWLAARSAGEHRPHPHDCTCRGCGQEEAYP